MFSLSALAQPEQDVVTYIETYSKLAMEEQNRLGVPAAITLAQGIHESAAGKSELAMNGNNHFGIKCKSNWLGDTMRHDDDKKQECFRKYISAEQSYIDHSDFLKGSNRYAFLFDLDVTDYIGWASGLKRAGYATNPLYVRKLTDLVEKYNLQKYTYEALKKKFETPGEIVPNKDANTTSNLAQVDDPNKSYKGLRGFWAQKGELLLDKSVANGIKYKTLLEFNDLPDEPLSQDMFLFVEKKRKTGTVEFHTVKDGETMQFISQKEAIQLRSLYAFNNMNEGEEPEVGEQLSLQYKSYGTPRLKPAPATAAETKVNTTDAPASSQTESPQPQKEAPSTSNVEVKTETKLIDNPAILNLEKARRTEALLGGGKLDEKVEVKVENKAPVEKLVNVQYGTTPTTEIPKAESKPVEVAEIKKEKPKAPKRTYNEPNVSESVKVLKEKFDEIVYLPLPEKKPVDQAPPTEKSTQAKVTTPIQASKQETKKDTASKKIISAKETKTIETKTAKVEKTSTGIVREVKKNDAKTEGKTVEDKKKQTEPTKKSTEKAKTTEKANVKSSKEGKTNVSKGKEKKVEPKGKSTKPSADKKTEAKKTTKTDPKKKK